MELGWGEGSMGGVYKLSDPNSFSSPTSDKGRAIHRISNQQCASVFASFPAPNFQRQADANIVESPPTFSSTPNLNNKEYDVEMMKWGGEAGADGVSIDSSLETLMHTPSTTTIGSDHAGHRTTAANGESMPSLLPKFPKSDSPLENTYPYIGFDGRNANSMENSVISLAMNQPRGTSLLLIGIQHLNGAGSEYGALEDEKRG